MVEKRLFLESYVGDVAIVTARYANHYETEIHGGELDGWLVIAKTESESRYNQRWAKRLVEQSSTVLA